MTKWRKSRGVPTMVGGVPTAGAVGTSATAATAEPTGGGAARTATAQPAPAGTVTAVRTRGRGRGVDSLRSPNPRVAPFGAARLHPGRARARRRCGGACLCHAHPYGPPVRDQGHDLRYQGNRSRVPSRPTAMGGSQHRWGG